MNFFTATRFMRKSEEACVNARPRPDTTKPGKSLVYRECQLSCWAQHALPFVSQLEAAATHSVGSVARWAVFCNSPALPCSTQKHVSMSNFKELRCSQSGPAVSDEMASSTAIRSATEGGCLLRKGRVQPSTHKALKTPQPLAAG